MTAKELETIIARHEMQQLELKESFGAEAIETACAFANAHGGFIVIGDDFGLVSRPRNRLIAQTFYDMHIIEHYGSGMRRMKKDCDENGSPCQKASPTCSGSSLTMLPRLASREF